MGRLSDSIKRLSNSIWRSNENEDGGLAEDPNESALDLERLQDSDSESDLEQIEATGQQIDRSDESDVALSDVEVDDDADVVPHQRKTIDNHRALSNARSSIELPKQAYKSFFEHMSITTVQPIVLKDIYDDTERELAFYQQGLDAAKQARSELFKAKIPFSRPVDYFAEMVKSDEHMGKLRQKLVSEETAKRASQEAKKQRELRKFGKKVQVEQLQKRQKEKRDTLDKIKDLKRKRDHLTDDQFDVEVEDALKDKKAERAAKYGLGANSKRAKKNEKYGSGGKKRGINRNTKESSMDISDFKQKKHRPGKSKRH